MQFFQTIKKLVSDNIDRAFNYLKSWFFGSNELLQTNNELDFYLEEEEEFIPSMPLALVGLCITASKQHPTLEITCKKLEPFHKDDKRDPPPPGQSLVWKVSTPHLDEDTTPNAAACAA